MVGDGDRWASRSGPASLSGFWGVGRHWPGEGRGRGSLGESEGPALPGCGPRKEEHGRWPQALLEMRTPSPRGAGGPGGQVRCWGPWATCHAPTYKPAVPTQPPTPPSRPKPPPAHRCVAQARGAGDSPWSSSHSLSPFFQAPGCPRAPRGRGGGGRAQCSANNSCGSWRHSLRRNPMGPLMNARPWRPCWICRSIKFRYSSDPKANANPNPNCGITPSAPTACCPPTIPIHALPGAERG